MTADSIMKNAFAMCKMGSSSSYSTICNRMASAGFSSMPMPFYYDTPECLIQASKTVKCTINHYFIVKAASALGLPYVMVLEEDAYPMKECRKEIDLMLNIHGIPEDADVVSFGNLSWIRPIDGYVSGIRSDFPYGVMDKTVWGSHAVLYMGRGYDNYLNAFSRFKENERCNSDHWHRMGLSVYHTYRSFFIQVSVRGRHSHADCLMDTCNITDFPGRRVGDGYVVGT